MVRIVLARILFILAIPIVFVGLIDPLEGGIAMLIAGAVYFIAFQLAGYGPRKYLWVPYLLSIVIGGLALLYAMSSPPRPDDGELALPIVVAVWIYRVAVLASLSGAITTAIFSFRDSK
ncbi:MAG: hypothetical protein RI917_278 [Actinomycetota bacterium]